MDNDQKQNTLRITSDDVEEVLCIVVTKARTGERRCRLSMTAFASEEFQPMLDGLKQHVGEVLGGYDDEPLEQHLAGDLESTS